MDRDGVITVSVDFPSTTALPVKFSGWRVRHYSEGGRPTPENQPCVMPSENATPIPFTASMQILTFKLMQRRNPSLTGGNFRSIFAGDTALTNGTGWDNAKQPEEIYADFVNGRDITAPLPRLQKAIIMAGSFTRGQKISGKIVCVPGVDGIDANKPMPTVDEVLQKGLYFYAVIGWTNSNGQWQIGHFGTKGAVAIPRFLKEPVEYNADWFTRWEGEYPDPLRIYL